MCRRPRTPIAMGDVVRGLSWLHGALAGWLRAGQSDSMADTRFDISRSLTHDLELRLTVSDCCLRLPLIMTQIAIHTA